MIVKRGRKWLLMSADGKRVLGEHDSREEAEMQELMLEKEREKERSAGGRR